jgi:hypothetical protein
MIFDTSPLQSEPSLFAGVPIEPLGLLSDKGLVHKFDVEKKLRAPQTTRDSQPVSTKERQRREPYGERSGACAELAWARA